MKFVGRVTTVLFLGEVLAHLDNSLEHVLPRHTDFVAISIPAGIPKSTSIQTSVAIVTLVVTIAMVIPSYSLSEV